jgi:hypothetical protein
MKLGNTMLRGQRGEAASLYWLKSLPVFVALETLLASEFESALRHELRTANLWLERTLFVPAKGISKAACMKHGSELN